MITMFLIGVLVGACAGYVILALIISGSGRK